MKVIFLDFDGVLNSNRYVRNCGHTGVVIDPSKMLLLKRIVESTDAKIVLTTSWKEHWDKNPDRCDSSGVLINKIFDHYGLQIYDKTPVVKPDRENEILEWIVENPGIENFVAIDDMWLSAEFLKGHTVKTSAFKDALEEEHVQEAIEILTTKKLKSK